MYFLDRLLDDDFVVEVGRLPGWVLHAVAKECFGLGLCLFFLGELGLLLVAARLERVVAGAGGGGDTVFQVVLLHLGDDEGRLAQLFEVHHLDLFALFANHIEALSLRHSQRADTDAEDEDECEQLQPPKIRHRLAVVHEGPFREFPVALVRARSNTCGAKAALLIEAIRGGDYECDEVTAIPEDGASSPNHSCQIEEGAHSHGSVRERQEEKDDTIVLEDGRPSCVEIFAAAIMVLPTDLVQLYVAHVGRIACALIIQVSLIFADTKLISISFVSIRTICASYPVNRD